MAYRRRQVISRASTFKEEIHHHQDFDQLNTKDPPHPSLLSSSYSFNNSSSSSSSLPVQAIKASMGPHDHHKSKSFDAYGDASKSGFWGVLAQKAREILEDDDPSQQHDDSTMHQHDKSHSYNNFSPVVPHSQEARTIVKSKTEDLRNQIKLKESSPKDLDQASGMWDQWQQPAQTTGSQTMNQTQLKASRDVAMATAAKAKLLLRELKTVKADLAFSKARCAQLEEENKLLRNRDGNEKGQNRADDDLIRLQLETLLAEKGRLANENEIYARENRFLREIVEYHQLTTEDVLYLDDAIEEEDDELYPMSARSSCSNRSPQSQTKTTFPMPPKEVADNNNTSENKAVSVSRDGRAK